jgi:hypothetical protein
MQKNQRTGSTWRGVTTAAFSHELPTGFRQQLGRCQLDEHRFRESNPSQLLARSPFGTLVGERLCTVCTILTGGHAPRSSGDVRASDNLPLRAVRKEQCVAVAVLWSILPINSWSV